MWQKYVLGQSINKYQGSSKSRFEKRVSEEESSAASPLTSDGSATDGSFSADDGNTVPVRTSFVFGDSRIAGMHDDYRWLFFHNQFYTVNKPGLY